LGWHAIVIAESPTTAVVSLLVLVSVSVLVLVKIVVTAVVVGAGAEDVLRVPPLKCIYLLTL
jgi:hypothetical protein